MSKVKDNTVDDEIDIMGLLQAILYRWWIVLIAAITGFAIALATTVFLITPKYSATSMIYMRGSGNTIASLADLQIGSELTNDYQIIFTSRTLLTKTIKELNLDMSYGQLKSMISISNPSDTRILQVEAWHKELYNELSDSNIMAFISAWFEFKYRRYYFFYDVFNHKSRWNDYDRNFVLIISKIIASVL